MTRNRSALLLLAGSLLVGPVVLPPTATAEPAGPLYRLVDTAARRLATADPVAASKWINNGPPIDDPPRAAAVLDAVDADATAHGIDPQYVRTVFTDQINATEGIEYTRFAQWKFDPALAPTTGPDLSESRTAIDGFTRRWSMRLRCSGICCTARRARRSSARQRTPSRPAANWTRCIARH